MLPEIKPEIFWTGKKVYCEYCNQFSEVVYMQSKEHIANECPLCLQRRKGQPYISKKKLQRIVENLPIRGNSYARTKL